MPQSFTCPSCAAPLEYEGTRAQKCPFCNSTVIVDSEVRSRFNEQPASGAGSLLEQAQRLKEVRRLIDSGNKIGAIKEFREIFGCGLKEAKDAVKDIEAGRPLVFTDYQNAGGEPGRSIQFDGEEAVKVAKTVGFSFLGIVLAILLFTGIIVAVVLYTVSSTINRTISSLKSTSAIPSVTTKPKGTAIPDPTPSFANEIFRLGGKGIGPGQFKDNRSVAIDPQGNIYSADYTGGRVQIFDAEGKFKNLIQVDEEKALRDLAVDRNGNLFILLGSDILRYQAATGNLLGKIGVSYPNDITIGLDGLLYATTNDGDIVVLTAEGKEVKRFKKVAAQANLKSYELEQITLDGQGNMYVIDRRGYYILKFSRDGKFLTRFGGQTDPDTNVKGTFRSFPDDIIADGKGNIFASSVSQIDVFNTDGNYIDSFKTTQAFGMAVTDKNELWVACRPFVVKYETK